MRTVDFGSLFQFIRNGLNVKQDRSGDGLPISRIETISDASVDGARVGYAGLTESECSDWLLVPGDILFSHINSVEHVGKCAVYRGEPEKLVHGMNLLCLRSDQSQLHPEFAKYLIRSSQFRSRLSNFINKAVNQASVSIGNLKTIPVTVPAVPEQRRIAEVLDRAEALRAKRRAALAQLDTLGASLFVEVFGDDDVRRSTSLDVTLGEVTSTITKGTTPTSVGHGFVDSGVPFVRVQNLRDGTVDWTIDPQFVSAETHRQLARSVIQPGDVLVSIAGTIGRIAIVGPGSVEMNCNQAVAIVRPTQRVRGDFLLSWLQRPEAQRQMRGAEVTATISNLSLTQIRGLRLSLPPLALQHEFARRIAAVDALKSFHYTSLSQLDALFASLQHRAFRGEL